MVVQLLEMRRLLKPSGSIHLHCDAIASHDLKLLTDSIIGRGQLGTRLFGNELTALIRGVNLHRNPLEQIIVIASCFMHFLSIHN